MINFKATKYGIDVFNDAIHIHRITPLEAYQLHLAINNAIDDYKNLTGKKIDEHISMTGTINEKKCE